MHPELFRFPGTHFWVPGYGAMIVIAFLGGTWWLTRRASKVKADPDACLSLALIALIFGWLGGRAFYVIHYWKPQFAHQPWQVLNLTAGGFEVYGGLMGAAGVALLYLWIRRLPMRLYCDMVAPSLLFGMGVGRFGCFLVGCCWGATCPATLPWAITFPALSSPHQQQWEDRIVTLPASLILVDSTGLGVPIPRQLLKMTSADMDKQRERYASADATIAAARASGNTLQLGQAISVKWALRTIFDHFEKFNTSPEKLRALADRPEYRSAPVHPAQLYSAIGPLLLAWLTNAYFFRRKRHGTVMALAMLLYGIERFIEEMVRMDNPVDTFGLTVSQAISIGFFLFGVGWLLILQKMPLRSLKPAIALPKGKVLVTQPKSAPPPSDPLRVNTTSKALDEFSDELAELGLSTNADWESIQSAYRSLSKQYHPDVYSHHDISPHMRKLGEEKFKKINNAYERIKNHLKT